MLGSGILYCPSFVHSWSLWPNIASARQELYICSAHTHPRRLNQPFLRISGGTGLWQTRFSVQRTERFASAAAGKKDSKEEVPKDEVETIAEKVEEVELESSEQ